jgi:hypothetical protein
MESYAIYLSITITLFPDRCFLPLNKLCDLKSLLTIERKLQLMTLKVKSDTVLWRLLSFCRLNLYGEAWKNCRATGLITQFSANVVCLIFTIADSNFTINLSDINPCL